ncbi:MAG: peptidoglycan-binding domain-containing protein [Pyrinomonadaceae bacterium]
MPYWLCKDKLIVKDKMVPFVISAPIKIGYLDPVEEVSGQLARLINLGYYRGPSERQGNAELLSAIEEFQCENNLTVDGKCGPKTQAKLKEIHGCMDKD